jgi:hypothetical protein
VSGVWCLVFGVWCLVFGVWCLVSGVWCLVFRVYGILKDGLRTVSLDLNIKDLETVCFCPTKTRGQPLEVPDQDPGATPGTSISKP